jgi:acyl dehydratase
MSVIVDEGKRENVTIEQLTLTVGRAGTPSNWLRVDQPMIDAFAAATGDDAYIHVDSARAAMTRFGGTIAHGLLTLSLLPQLIRSATPQLQGSRLGVNYGFDRVRFILPVPVNSRIRAIVALIKLVENKPQFFVLTYDVTIEIEDTPKPAATARWLLGRWME